MQTDCTTMKQAQERLEAYKKVFTHAYLLTGEEPEAGIRYAKMGAAPTGDCLHACRCCATASCSRRC